MTHSDYELIARVINHEYTQAYKGAGPSLAEKSALHCVAIKFATELEKDDQHFPREWFLASCGL